MCFLIGVIDLIFTVFPISLLWSIQNVGMNLRDLLSKVDAVIQDLPAQTHQEVS